MTTPISESVMALLMDTRYMVTSFGGVGTSGKPDEQWFLTLARARDEVKRRLQLLRLDGGARETGRHPGTIEGIWIHEGLKWYVALAIDYSAVPRSDPDFGRSGGCTFYEMRSLTEGKPS